MYLLAVMFSTGTNPMELTHTRQLNG